MSQRFEILTAWHSIAYGVIVGVFSYVIINGFVWIVSRISSDRILPPNYDASEPWVIPPGGIVPTWIKILLNRNTRVIDELPSEYPFEVRQRHSNISVETTSQDRSSPRKVAFMREK
jgi:AGZA family xanthine/uracil permease-like MFS transporter